MLSDRINSERFALQKCVLSARSMAQVMKSWLGSLQLWNQIINEVSDSTGRGL